MWRMSRNYAGNAGGRAGCRASLTIVLILWVACIQGFFTQRALRTAAEGAEKSRLRRNFLVIARVWHGFTQLEHADAYEAMLKPELLPGISQKKGYRGSYLLRRNAGAEVEFITVLLFDSLDDIRAAAGHADYETAIIPEERRKYLSRYDAKSAHYEVAAVHGLRN